MCVGRWCSLFTTLNTRAKLVSRWAIFEHSAHDHAFFFICSLLCPALVWYRAKERYLRCYQGQYVSMTLTSRQRFLCSCSRLWRWWTVNEFQPAIVDILTKLPKNEESNGSSVSIGFITTGLWTHWTWFGRFSIDDILCMMKTSR